jgi:muconolactone D-isomerase
VLFAVTMHVALPPDLDPEVRADTIAREKAYSQQLQREGTWVHIWRRVGQYSNLSIFDVEGNAQLHDILWQLPLFPYMSIEVVPLSPHPSDIAVDAAAAAGNAG